MSCPEPAGLMDKSDNDQGALQVLMDDSAAELLAGCPWAAQLLEDVSWSK